MERTATRFPRAMAAAFEFPTDGECEGGVCAPR